MAQKTDTNLQTQRAQIENETTTGANTAARVGQMFEDEIDSKINVDKIVDEDDMSSNSASLIPTQQSVKAYVDANVGSVAAADVTNTPSGGIAATDVQSALNELDSEIDSRIAASIAGFKWKDAVRIATTVAGTLASSFENGDTVDGVVLATGNRILIKNQAVQTENGIYTVNPTGTPTRSTDADAAAELEGAAMTIAEGTSNANTTWLQITDSITLGVSNIVFTQIGATVPAASSTTPGIAKLYPSTSLGSNTDGAPDQNSVKVYADAKVADAINNGTTTIAPSQNVVFNALALKADATIFTREFNRTFDDEILFDKNEIDYAPHELNADVDITVAASGNVIDNFSVAIQTIITDGAFSLTFTGFAFIHGAANGDIPTAGTYQIYYMYRNGVATVYFGVPSSEEANLTPLASPGSFAAVADGETEIDLSWSNVANESSYLIQVSLDGSTGWTNLNAPAVNVTSYSQTGLTAGDTRFYRIKSVGDGIAFADSQWVSSSATTEEGGDATAPDATFAPLSGVTGWAMNRVIVITMDEAIRDDDGVTAITSGNVNDYLVLKETNSGGADIPYTATIDVSKTVITITPSPTYGGTQLVYWAIDGIEDVNGNEAALQSSTFTTSNYTIFSGAGSRLQFGDVLDSLFSANDTNFWLEITIQNHSAIGNCPIITKYSASGNQRQFSLYTIDSDILFVWWTDAAQTRYRQVRWTGGFLTGEQTLVLKYDGSIDTNNGLDRVILTKNGGTVGSKTLDGSNGVLGGILNGTAYLALGAYVGSTGSLVAAAYFNGEMKDFIIRSTAGSVEEINVPLIVEGTDTSGNSVDGTWIP